MTEASLKVGAAVNFRTPGRYPREMSGKIVSIDSAFAEVELADGTTRKARPATLRAA